MLVHGDANYFYHDSNGIQHRADLEALAQAIHVAKTTELGEVFVFYQKPKKQSLLPVFASRQNGEFYHYRNGQLKQHKAYVRQLPKGGLLSEIELFQELSSNAPVRFLVYFGHEIGAISGMGGAVSLSSQKNALNPFTDALQGFAEKFQNPSQVLGIPKPFDLIVMSSCYGGNQRTLEALSPFTQYLLGSPSSLHLSYLDIAPFGDYLNRQWPLQGSPDICALGNAISEASFQKLKVMTTTEISIAFFQTETLGSDSYGLGNSYEKASSCLFPLPQLRYQAPRFGRRKGTTVPLGWTGLRGWADKKGEPEQPEF